MSFLFAHITYTLHLGAPLLAVSWHDLGTYAVAALWIIGFVSWVVGSLFAWTKEQIAQRALSRQTVQESEDRLCHDRLFGEVRSLLFKAPSTTRFVALLELLNEAREEVEQRVDLDAWRHYVTHHLERWPADCKVAPSSYASQEALAALTTSSAPLWSGFVTSFEGSVAGAMGLVAKPLGAAWAERVYGIDDAAIECAIEKEPHHVILSRYRDDALKHGERARKEALSALFANLCALVDNEDVIEESYLFVPNRLKAPRTSALEGALQALTVPSTAATPGVSSQTPQSRHLMAYRGALIKSVTSRFDAAYEERLAELPERVLERAEELRATRLLRAHWRLRFFPSHLKETWRTQYHEHYMGYVRVWLGINFLGLALIYAGPRINGEEPVYFFAAAAIMLSVSGALLLALPAFVFWRRARGELPWHGDPEDDSILGAGWDAPY